MRRSVLALSLFKILTLIVFEGAPVVLNVILAFIVHCFLVICILVGVALDL